MTDSFRSTFAMVLALGGATFVSFVACSSDPATSPPGGSSGTSGDDDDGTSSGAPKNASAFAKEVCARIERCYAGSVANGWGDAATCAAAFDKSNANTKAAKNSGITDAALDACLAKLKTADCALFQDDIPECRFKGSVAAGGACSDDTQCATGSCFFDGDGDCGKCKPTVAIGASCADANCDPGSSCDDEGTIKCMGPVAEGGSCESYTVDCAIGLRCIADKCTKASASGAACTPESEDSDDSCGDGFSCISGKCAAVTVTAKTGATCGGGVGCINGVCVSGKCVANLAEGAKCDDDAEDPPFCQRPMECLDGKCAFEKPPECK